MTKKILYVDMDGVLVDFQSGIDQLDETKQNEYKIKVGITTFESLSVDTPEDIIKIKAQMR